MKTHKTKITATLAATILAAAVLAVCVPARAAVIIRNDDIIPTSNNETQSGNGNVDLILFGFSGGGGVTENADGPFDGDDANTQMPTGGPTSIAGSYMTSMGEIRDFYRYNFPDLNNPNGTFVDQIVLFLDLNETSPNPYITLNKLEIVIDYDLFQAPDDRNTPDTVDISSAVQDSTGAVVSGGTLLAQFDPNSVPKQIALNEQGAGFADHYILTGIDPFDQAYADDTRVQFVWSSTDHDDGGDKVFLSGSFTGIPEPTTMVLLGIASLGLLKRKKR